MNINEYKHISHTRTHWEREGERGKRAREWKRIAWEYEWCMVMKPVWMWYRKTLFDWFNFALFLPWVFLVCAPSVLIVYAMPFCFLPIYHASHQIRINIINSLHFIRVFAALQLMKLYLHTNRFPQTWNSFWDMISLTHESV